MSSRLDLFNNKYEYGFEITEKDEKFLYLIINNTTNKSYDKFYKELMKQLKIYKDNQITDLETFKTELNLFLNEFNDFKYGITYKGITYNIEELYNLFYNYINWLSNSSKISCKLSQFTNKFITAKTNIDVLLEHVYIKYYNIFLTGNESSIHFIIHTDLECLFYRFYMEKISKFLQQLRNNSMYIIEYLMKQRFKNKNPALKDTLHEILKNINKPSFLTTHEELQTFKSMHSIRGGAKSKSYRK